MACCECEGKSFLKTLCALFFNLISFGFIGSLFLHNNAQCSWQEGLTPDDKVSVFNLFLGAYFSLHVFTWYVVFWYLYASVISVLLQAVMPCLNLCYRNESVIYLFAEFLYGYWAAGEILGGWCDLERIGDCIQSDTGDCQSFFINLCARTVQGICERLTSSYDEQYDAYSRRSASAGMCLLTFRYMGHFIMTCLSSLFTYFTIF